MFKLREWSFVSCDCVGSQCDITLERKPTLLGKLLFRKPKRYVFVGDGLDWYFSHGPDYIQVDRDLKLWLNAIYQRKIAQMYG